MNRHTLFVAVFSLLACSPPAPNPMPDAGARPSGAVLLAERFSTPDGRVMYMGAFPSLPTGSVEVSQLTELGPEGDVFTCAGAGFLYNPVAGTITRYDVADDLSLEKGASLNVLQEGIVGWTGAHVCRSATQAFIFNGEGGRVVEWNPTAMSIISAFDIPKPTVGSGLALQFFEPKIVGDLVFFSVAAINWDTVAVEPRSIVAVFDMRDKSVTLDTDDRCQGSIGGFVDSAGNYYQVPEDGAFYSTYSPTPNLPPDCVLRVKAGQKTYDDTYAQRLPQGFSLRSMWPIDDRRTLAAMISTASMPAPADMWNWYSLPVAPTSFDLETGATQAYPGLTDVQPMNSRKLTLDGQSYYQSYTFDADGDTTRVTLMRLDPSGATATFTLEGGDVLALERLW